MNHMCRYTPLPFFVLTFTISWISWIFAIYASRQLSMQHLLLPFILIGISGPAVSAFIMLIKSKNKDMRHDFYQRLRPASITKRFIPIVLFLFPCQLLLAIVLSLLFGQPIEQFSIATQSPDQALQGIYFLATLFVMFLVGPFEEIGWRGYGIESLRSKYNLLKTSFMLGAIWGLWHVPLFFVQNGFFQKVWELGLLHTSIYFVNFLLITIITNWLYIKNNRSIFIAIIFHNIYDACLSMIQIPPATWLMLTLIMLLTSVIIILQDKDLFLQKDT